MSNHDDDRDALRTVRSIDYARAVCDTLRGDDVPNLDELLVLVGKSKNEFAADLLHIKTENQRNQMLADVHAIRYAAERIAAALEKMTRPAD